MDLSALPTRSREFCAALDLSVPIVQAPMAGGPTSPELVAAVCNDGALGSVGAGYMEPDDLDAYLTRLGSLTQRAVHVNVMVVSDPGAPPPRSEVDAILEDAAADVGASFSREFDYTDRVPQQIEVLCEHGVPVVSFTFGLPTAAQIDQLHRAGAVFYATANTLAEVDAVVDSGCDGVLLQGSAAGGHRGGLADTRFASRVDLLPLVSAAAERVRCPLVAAGGIMNGRGILASIAAGAAAAALGTAFLVSDESGASQEWKDAITHARDDDTTLTASFSGREARGINNAFIERMAPLADRLPAYPILNTWTRPMRSAAKASGQTDYMSLWSGQGAPMARPMPAAELVRTLEAELVDALAEFGR